MKAKIIIEFKKIFGESVDDMKKSKQLKKSTEKTINKLTQQIRKYFRDFKIETTTEYEIIE